MFLSRLRRVTVITGAAAVLVLAAGAGTGTRALGAAAPHEATVSHGTAQSAYVKAALAKPEATPSCATINDRGNGKYATDRVDDLYPYFEAQSEASSYCNVSVPEYNGNFEIWDPTTGGCLATESDVPDSAVHEDTAAACTGNSDGKDNYAWDDWFALSEGTYHSQTVWAVFNEYNGGCLYDDLQEPAVTTECVSTGQFQTDAFEHFVWDALP
jgi:hypothetical protein